MTKSSFNVVDNDKAWINQITMFAKKIHRKWFTVNEVNAIKFNWMCNLIKKQVQSNALFL